MYLIAENEFQILEYNFFVYLNLGLFFILKCLSYNTTKNKVIFL